VSGSPWWKTGVIYQIAVSSFADSDGDGRGDLRGIIGKLDYLNDGTEASLGVDAIWLTPINTSPLRDFGYDVADYRTIDPRFGTLEDLDELIAECHRRGMRVMMDLVLNHTSDEHPWFVESRSSRDNPRRDWYVWKDGRSPGKPPNDWLAVVEGSAWAYDETTGQYYYHAFLPFQPDLNWRNPEVRQEMLDVAEFWLGRGVDGFRLDLINFLYEDAALRDNPGRLGIRPYLAQRHVHDFSQPESLEVAQALRGLADGFGERALMGEVCTDTPDDCLAYLGDGTDRLHLSFYLDFIRQRWSATGFSRSVGWLEANLPPAAWPCYYLDNHDLPRSFTRLGAPGAEERRARVAAAMLLTLRGTPIIYYGQELGMARSRVPRQLMDDPVGIKFWPLRVGRDGSRTPMQWAPGPDAGFTDGTPWLPVDAMCARRNVATELAQPGSLLDWYRRLIRLRRATLALQTGSYRAIRAMPGGVYAYVREHGGKRAAVLLNFAARASEPELPADIWSNRSWTCALSTHTAEGEIRGPRLKLEPYEALILISG